MKKTVGFLATKCLHEPTPDELAKMTPDAVLKLTREEREEWELEVAGKAKPGDIAQLTPERQKFVRYDLHSGTGFFVSYPEPRAGKDAKIGYLVTNHHMSQPGIEVRKPCNVLGYSLYLNHRGATKDSPVYISPLLIGADTTWYYADNDATVDVAVTPIVVQDADWDVVMIPKDLFVTPEMVSANEIVEGDPVIFAGLFLQFAGTQKIEPIVRSGSIAMLPGDPILTQLGLAHVYLSDAHVFGGNSGSPMFVDINKFKQVLGFDYRLLGVVAGEMYEQTDFSLQPTVPVNGRFNANSGISYIVPASEIKKILEGPALQKGRDDFVASLQSKK